MPGRAVMGRQTWRAIRGRLDLSGRGLASLADIPVDHGLKVLVVNGNALTSFATLKPQPNLHTIEAVDNPIKWLNGLEQQVALRNLDITGAPICDDEKFRRRVLATVGDQLMNLNGQKLTRDDMEAAEIMRRKRVSSLYVAKEGELPEVGLDPATAAELQAIYAAEHRTLLWPFAVNDAVLRDLMENGPLPQVGPSSTDEGYQLAIDNLAGRIRWLRGEVEGARGGDDGAGSIGGD